VPTEHSLPGADVAVRGSDSSNFDVNGMVEEGIEGV